MQEYQLKSNNHNDKNKGPYRKNKKGTNNNKDNQTNYQDDGPRVNFSKLPGAIKNILGDYDWCYAMELFRSSYDAIHMLVKILVKNNKFDEAYSVICHTEHDLPTSNWPKLHEAYEMQALKVLPNFLQDDDYFGPVGYLEPDVAINKFINLKDYGFKKDDVKFLGKEDQARIGEAFIELTKNGAIVGIDAESFDKDLNFRMGHMQTLQVATSKFLYIFDIESLKKQGWFKNHLLNQLKSKDVAKVFHGAQGDIVELQRTAKLSMHVNDCKNIVDFSTMFRKKDGNNVSLAYLCEKFLGKKLCKYNCRSNWGQNLRSSQIHYAALDAYVQVEIEKRVYELKDAGQLKAFMKENGLIDDDQWQVIRKEREIARNERRAAKKEQEKLQEKVQVNEKDDFFPNSRVQVLESGVTVKKVNDQNLTKQQSTKSDKVNNKTQAKNNDEYQLKENISKETDVTFARECYLTIINVSSNEIEESDLEIQSTLALANCENTDEINKKLAKKIKELPTTVSKSTNNWIRKNI